MHGFILFLTSSFWASQAPSTLAAKYAWAFLRLLYACRLDLMGKRSLIQYSSTQRLFHQFLGSRKYERHRGYRQQGSRIKGEENGKPPALWKYHINPGNCGRLTALTSKCGRAVDSLYSLQNPVKANPSSCKGVVLTGYCLV